MCPGFARKPLTDQDRQDWAAYVRRVARCTAATCRTICRRRPSRSFGRPLPPVPPGRRRPPEPRGRGQPGGARQCDVEPVPRRPARADPHARPARPHRPARVSRLAWLSPRGAGRWGALRRGHHRAWVGGDGRGAAAGTADVAEPAGTAADGAGGEPSRMRPIRGRCGCCFGGRGREKEGQGLCPWTPAKAEPLQSILYRIGFQGPLGPWRVQGRALAFHLTPFGARLRALRAQRGHDP